MKWYDNFLSHDDVNIRVEEYEPNITFADARRTILQQIVKYGKTIYNTTKGECINIGMDKLRSKKIKTDVHEYRVRLKYPHKVHSRTEAEAKSIKSGSSGPDSAGPQKYQPIASPGVFPADTYTKWTGKSYAANEYVIIYLGFYDQTDELKNLFEVRCVPENTVLNVMSGDFASENFTVVDIDPNSNAILVRRAPLSTTEDGALPGTLTPSSWTTSWDGEGLKWNTLNEMYVSTTGLYEDDWASNNAGIEQVAKLKNYVQMFDVKFGSTIESDHMVFHGGDPRKAMDQFWCEELNEKIENAYLRGQGRYNVDPSNPNNRQSFMQGLLPALGSGPNASKLCVNMMTKYSEESKGPGWLTPSRLNDFFDTINDKDNSLAPCLCSRRFLDAVNKIVRDSVETHYDDTSAGNQTLEWRSNIGIQKLIYYPFLDDGVVAPYKTGEKDSSGNPVYNYMQVDCIKYDLDRYARECKLVPLTIRDGLGKTEARTTTEKWLFTATTCEWGHPELGGFLGNVVDGRKQEF